MPDTRSVENSPVHQLIYPKKLAVVGASNDFTKMGTIQALNILVNGYKGEVFFVHPREKEVLGRPAFTKPEGLPDGVDLAVLIVPTGAVPELLEGFGRRGVKRVIITSGGFKEVGAEGVRLEEEVKTISKKYGIRFIGPNCIGIINTDIMLNTTFLPYVGKRGNIGLVSQSGSYVTQTTYYLAEHEIHLSKAFSIGNEGDLNMIDCMRYLAQDEQTKAIALYIETIRRGREFIEAAREISRIKPIVALYVGGTKAGGRAGQSHTGALAGSIPLYRGIFKQAGIIQAETVDDMYFWAFTFAHLPPPKGKRVVVLTNSGGPGASIADALEKAGMEVPELSEELQTKLKETLPHTGSAKNPVDLTFHRDFTVMVKDFPELLLPEPEIDGMIVHGTLGSGFQRAMYHNLKHFVDVSFEDFQKMLKPEIRPLLDVVKATGKPIIRSNFLSSDDDVTTEGRKLGLPSYRRPEDAARAMRALYECGLMNKLPPFIFEKLQPKKHTLIEKAEKASKHGLNEYEAKRVLADYGIAVPTEEIVKNEEQLGELAKKIGFPLVLKAVGDEILHKTELGLVVVGIENQKRLASEFKAMHKRLSENKLKGELVLCEQVEGTREFMIGATRFANFGPVILFGLGGIFAEALEDVAFRTAPIDKNEALRMIEEIRAVKLLSAFRGEKPVNKEALAEILVKVSRFVTENESVKELDLNPIKITPEGKSVALDALIRV